MDALDFRLLGPLEVRRGDELLAAGGGKRGALLAALLLSANHAVSLDRLALVLWGEELPRSGTNLIQGYVSDWRQVLEPDRAPRSSGVRIVSTQNGYRLQVSEQECDLLRFRSLDRQGRAAARAGDISAARQLLRRALQEWRGPALVGLRCDQLADTIASLDEAWLTSIEAAADIELGLGRPDDALAQLADPSSLHPLRERLVELRMLALAAAGRQAEALIEYEAVRSRLAETLGVDPGAALRQLHLRILRQDPSLQERRAPTPSTEAIPVPLSSFIGREKELRELTAMIPDHRLVTMTGPGGSGKTRLAIETIGVLTRATDRAIAFVDLSPVRDLTLLWTAVANALRLRLSPDLAPPLALARQLGPQPILLVLDNMEHLAGAAPDIASVLLLAPQLSIVATSREPLGVTGEWLFPVAPLRLPGDETADRPLAMLEAAAVRLFVDRARAVDPAFAVTAADAAVVAGICRRLDGLPLALELAAPWTKTLSLPALLERLDRPLSLLVSTSGATDRPMRHRTMRAAIDWSYSARTDDERRLLEQLSVFISGAPLATLEAVAGLGDATLTTLAGLIDSNLVYRASVSGEHRYRLLETVREYAAEQLATRPADQRAMQERHADYFCALAERTARSARTLAGLSLGKYLAAEQDEIRAALRYLASDGLSVRVLTLVIDCLPLWWDHGYVREGYTRLVEALDDCPGAGLELLAAANTGAAILGESAAQPEAALARARAATVFAQRAGSRALEAVSRCLQGNMLSYLDWEGTATDGITMLAKARRLGSTVPTTGLRWGWSSRESIEATWALLLVDIVRYRDPQRGRDVVDSVWGKQMARGDNHLASFVLRQVGFLASDAGRWPEAEDRLSESLRAATESGSVRSESRSAEELARLAWARARFGVAAGFAGRATTLSREAGTALNWARCSALLADIATAEGDTGTAEHLLDDAEAAVLPDYPRLAVRTVAPRRARLARLAGRTEDCLRHLAEASTMELMPALPPNRVIYLLEAGYLAAALGEHDRVAALTARLTGDAGRLGLFLPLPEVGHLDGLFATIGGPLLPT